jgi:tetratricopeptide (TPR) repeat protein/TolB-like protein
MTTSSDDKTSTIFAATLTVPDEQASTADPGSGNVMAREREVLQKCITASGGRLRGSSGDTFLAVFETAESAVNCAAELASRVRDLLPDASVGIGIDSGQTAEDTEGVFGAAVDAAIALRTIAGSRGIVIGDAAFQRIGKTTALKFRKLEPRVGSPAIVPAYIATGDEASRSRFAIFEELIRRRVFRAAGAYIVVSWILVQVASIVFPEFDFPGWSMRALIVLLTAAFPLVMLLAWTFDLTRAGFALTAHSEYSRARGNVLRIGTFAVATMISAAVLWWVWIDYIEPTTQRPTRADIKRNPVIAVTTPGKLSGPPEIDWLGAGVADLIRNELAESRWVIVFSQSRWNAVADGAATREELVDRARQAGIDYLIGGVYLTRPNGIFLSVWLEDIENGTELASTRISATDAAGIVASSSEMAVGVKRALSIPLVDTVSHYSADFAVNNMAAYEAYVAGLGFLANFDFGDAETSFRAALSLAPDYHMARFRLAGILEATGQSQAAWQALEAIPDGALITPRERYYVEGARSSFAAQRDPEKSIDTYSQLRQEYPYDHEGGQHLAEAYWLNYQEDKSIALYRELTTIHSYEPLAWMALGERLLDVGQLDEAEPVLHRYADMAQDDHFAAALLGKLAQLSGRYEESIQHYDRSLALKPDFAIAILGLARSRYLQGDIDASESLFRQLAGDTNQAAQFRIDAAFDLAGILRGQGRFTPSIQILQQLDAIIREEGLYIASMNSTLGSTQMELGNVDLATTLLDQAIRESPVVPTRYLFARGMFELRVGDAASARQTAGEIQALALPDDDPDRTEDKAASYLLGIASLQAAELGDADGHLRRASELDGYEYAVYAAGLARLLFARGEMDEAASIALAAASDRDPGDLRLDLELDRARALLLHAEILAAQGNSSAARAHARQFIEQWRHAGEQASDLLLARRLLSGN